METDNIENNRELQLYISFLHQFKEIRFIWILPQAQTLNFYLKCYIVMLTASYLKIEEIKTS